MLAIIMFNYHYHYSMNVQMSLVQMTTLSFTLHESVTKNISNMFHHLGLFLLPSLVK